MQRKIFCGLIAILLLALILPLGIPAKVQDRVEPGDVIRTHTICKAQLSMVDASVITLAPESRLAIAHYQYNPARFSPDSRARDSGIRKNLLALMGAKEYY